MKRAKNKTTPMEASIAQIKKRPAPALRGKSSSAFKKLLVPVDFSEPSKKALKCALQFAEQLGATVTLAHVVDLPLYPHDWDYMPLADPKAARADLEREARNKLRILAADDLDGMPINLAVRIGKPWSEIVALAKTENPDLIIIGTHGHTGLKHVVLGSTAERVVRHAHCPVLVVR